jgi:hypothetical protein
MLLNLLGKRAGEVVEHLATGFVWSENCLGRERNSAAGLGSASFLIKRQDESRGLLAKQSHKARGACSESVQVDRCGRRQAENLQPLTATPACLSLMVDLPRSLLLLLSFPSPRSFSAAASAP